MDPRYIDFGEFDSSQHKKNYEIRAGPDLYRSVSVLGWGMIRVR